MIIWNQSSRVYPQSRGIGGFFAKLVKNIFTLPVGDCHCNAVGKQAIMTGTGYQVSITGKGYQATIAGVNG
jgi:hypothetical protein